MRVTTVVITEHVRAGEEPEGLAQKLAPQHLHLFTFCSITSILDS